MALLAEVTQSNIVSILLICLFCVGSFVITITTFLFFIIRWIFSSNLDREKRMHENFKERVLLLVEEQRKQTKANEFQKLEHKQLTELMKETKQTIKEDQKCQKIQNEEILNHLQKKLEAL